MTTHYMDEAEWCDRIAIMDHGEIVALDDAGVTEGQVGKDRVMIHTDDDDAAIAALPERFGIEAKISRGRGHVRRGVRRGVRPEAVRRAGRADQGGERVTPDAGRRVHVLHGHARSAMPRRTVQAPQQGDDADDERRPTVSSTVQGPQGTAAAEANGATTDARTANGAAGNGAATAPASRKPVVRVHVPKRSWRSELRAIKIVWRRELIRFRADRVRIADLARAAVAVPVRARYRPAEPRQRRHRRHQSEDLHLSRDPLHRGDVHRDVLRSLDRLGS